MKENVLFMSFILKTDYKRGDWFTAQEANATNKAILVIDASVQKQDGKFDAIGEKIGTGKLNTKNSTIIGAINELNDSSTKYEINSIEEKDINDLFPNNGN